MLQSLFATRQPEFDPALGDSLGRKILLEARQGKANLLSTEIAKLRQGEWDRRAFYVDMAGQYLKDIRVLETLPDTSIGNLIRGSIAINLAWKARGGGTADMVSQEGAMGFVKNLNFAAKCLLRSGEQDMEDPTPFAFLQTVAMGLQLERKMAESWFQEAVKRDASNQQAHYRHLTLLCKKWGGSHEEMFDFSRTAIRNTPSDSTLNSLLFLAFQEYYLFFVAFDKDVEGAKALLNDKQVHQESLDLYHRSFQDRKTIEKVSDYWPHNVAAWWFFMLRIPEVVRQETKKIGPYFTEYPWKMFYGNPAKAYHSATKV